MSLVKPKKSTGSVTTCCSHDMPGTGSTYSVRANGAAKPFAACTCTACHGMNPSRASSSLRPGTGLW